MIPSPIPSSSPPPPPAPYNPYAAPVRASDRPEAASLLRAPGEDIKWMFLALAAAADTLTFVAVRGRHYGLTKSSIESLLFSALGVDAIACAAVLCWLYIAWSHVPLRNRVLHSPLGVVVKMIVPFPVWHVLLQKRLCDSIDGALAECGELADAPKTLGMLAGGALFAVGVVSEINPRIGLFATLASDVLWFFFMFDCDASRRMLVEALSIKRARELRQVEAKVAASLAQPHPYA